MIDLRHATGHGMRVVIADSGVHADHPHVGWTLRGFGVTLVRGRAYRSDDSRDVNGHGTACAALVRWGAPDAGLIPVRVLDANLEGHSGAIAAALSLLVAERPDVLNLSLGVTANSSGALDDALSALARGGTTIVAATAPGGLRRWPCDRPGVLTVGADPALRHWAYRVDRSGDGPAVTASPYPRPIPGRAPEANLVGTSFAAPRVSALVARAREISGPLGVPALLEILEANAAAFSGR